MKIVFMGTPSFSVPILKALSEKYEVLLVVTQPDKVEGRKKILTKPPVKVLAESLQIPVFQPVSLKDDFDKILELDADMLVTAAYGQFVPTKVLKHFKKAINVHGSLLPKRRGGAPIQRAIMEGETKTGVTIMEMVKKMDAGRMYAKTELPILDSDNNTSLFEKLSIAGTNLLMENIEDIYNEINLGVPQNEEDSTYNETIKPYEEELSFDLDAKTLFNRIRGLAMEPGAYFKVNGTRFKVYESKIIYEASIPGYVYETKKHLIIGTSDYKLEFLLVKSEGKNMMSAKDFLNGQKLFIKDSIISK